MFQEAIRLDERYAAPYAFTALWHSACLLQGWSQDQPTDRAAIDQFASAALQRDPTDVWALSLSGQLRALWFHDFDTAFDLLGRALRTSPSSAFAHARSSPPFSYVGDGAEGRRLAEQALRLSPFDPQVFFTYGVLGLAAYTEGDYDAAVAWGRRSHASNARYTANIRTLTGSLAAAGKLDEARSMGLTLLTLDPAFRVRRFCQTYAYREQERLDRLASHLLLAGLPE
jgi:adenylate cyclase